MINGIIRWSMRNPFLVVCASLFLVAYGVWSLVRTPVDAVPDLSENQVIVFADWMGRSPQEVEDQVTHPLSVNLQGLAGVRTVRATSMFGFSIITVIFFGVLAAVIIFLSPLIYNEIALFAEKAPGYFAAARSPLSLICAMFFQREIPRQLVITGKPFSWA